MIIDGEEVELVSAHGGHSGQFCSHADGALEDIVLAYIEKGFSWIGITEHIPPAEDRFLFPFDQGAGYTAKGFQARFYEYTAHSLVCPETKLGNSSICEVALSDELYNTYTPSKKLNKSSIFCMWAVYMFLAPPFGFAIYPSKQ